MENRQQNYQNDDAGQENQGGVEQPINSGKDSPGGVSCEDKVGRAHQVGEAVRAKWEGHTRWGSCEDKVGRTHLVGEAVKAKWEELTR